MLKCESISLLNLCWFFYIDC